MTLLPTSGRVVMVSGAARGIGRAIVDRLHTDGYTVSLGGRDPAAMQAVVDHWSADGDGAGPNAAASVHAFDAGDNESAHRWVAETLEAHGSIDALVNNAGVLHDFGLDDYDEAAFDQMLAINVKMPTLLTHLTLPHLRRCGHGRVVNIASLSGKRVKGGFSPGYAMSKHAVMALTHATRQHGWPDGIRATAICPSFVATDMIAEVDTGAEPVIDPSDIAHVVAAALVMPNHSSIPEIAVNCRLEDLF